MSTTTNLGLTKPAYLSDGQTAVSAVNTNFDTIDALIGNILVYDGEILTYGNELLITNIL